MNWTGGKKYVIVEVAMEKEKLRNAFAMNNLGLARKIFGMQIIHDREIKKIWLSLQQYLGKVLEKINMVLTNFTGILISIKFYSK